MERVLEAFRCSLGLGLGDDPKVAAAVVVGWVGWLDGWVVGYEDQIWCTQSSPYAVASHERPATALTSSLQQIFGFCAAEEKWKYQRSCHGTAFEPTPVLFGIIRCDQH